VNEYRLDLARKLGATKAINISKEKIEDCYAELNMVNGFDIGLEVSGNPSAFKDMLAHMYHGGNVALLGLLPKSTQINWDEIIFKGIHVKGIYGREMYETWYKMTQMIRGGLDISGVLTHQFNIDDFQKAFEVMESGQCGKVVLNWSNIV
jgi:threonine 3-dehydrogenase